MRTSNQMAWLAVQAVAFGLCMLIGEFRIWA